MTKDQYIEDVKRLNPRLFAGDGKILLSQEAFLGALKRAFDAGQKRSDEFHAKMSGPGGIFDTMFGGQG